MKLTHRKLMTAMFFLTAFAFCISLAFVGGDASARKSDSNPGQGTSTPPTYTYHDDGSVASITQTTTYKDGSFTTTTNYDQETHHETGSTTVDKQTKDGETTTTTITRDGNGHETGKTIERVDKDGKKTIEHFKDGKPLDVKETDGKNETEVTWQYDKQGRILQVVAKKNGKFAAKMKKLYKDGKDNVGTAQGFHWNEEEESWDNDPEYIAYVLRLLKRFGFLLGLPEYVTETAGPAPKEKPKQKIPKIPKESGESAESTSAQGTATDQLVGVVFDKNSRPEEQAIMTITDAPKKYDNIPGVGVVPVKVNGTRNANGQLDLAKLVVYLPNGQQHPANQPFTLELPNSASTIPIGLKSEGNQNPSAQVNVPITQGKSNTTVVNTGKASDFTTPPVCQNTSFIRGPLSGDAHTQRIMVDDQPATIIAGSTTTVFFDLPSGISAGPHQLTIQDGSRSASFPIVRMSINGDIVQPELQRGQKTKYDVTVILDDSVWQHSGGMSPELVNSSQIQQAAPGFRIPKPGEDGVVLLSVTNGSPGVVKTRAVMRALHKQDFQNNQFTTAGEVQSLQSGGFVLNLLAQAFFAPIHGEEVLGGMLLTISLGGEEFDENGKKIQDVDLPVNPGWKCEQGKCPKLQTTKSGKIYCQSIKDDCGTKECPGTCLMLIGHTEKREGKDVEEWGLTGYPQYYGRVPKEEDLPTDPDKKEKEIEKHAIKPGKGKYSCGCA